MSVRGWTPTYAPWRHGGYYVTNVRYPSGACGCVSNNYADRKWRIVTENTGPGAEGDRTFRTRDDAARAELERATGHPAPPKGSTVVIQLAGTQVILTAQGFYSRCERCPWVTGEIVHARHQAHDAAKSHEQQACEAGAEGFYVTVKNGSQTGYLLGPYGSKEEAEGNVDRGQCLARQVNDRADFYAYGVTRVVMQPGRELPKGRLNDVELVTS